MIFKPAWALKASISALVWRIISSIGRSNWKFTGLTLNLVLASASGLLFCFFMLLVVLVCSFISPPSLSARQPNHQPLFQLFKRQFRAPLSLAKMLSDVAGQERWVFCAGVVQSSNGGLSGMGAEQVFPSRRKSARFT